MKVMLLLLTAMLVPVGLLVQSSHRESSDKQVNPNALIEDGAVKRVLIFHVPDSTMTRVALTPQALLSLAGPVFEITGDIKESLRLVFAGVSFQKEKHTPDLRWGVLFYDVNNHEIGEVFVDKFGQYGYVNREAGSFAGDHPGFNIAKELNKLTGDRR